MAKGPKSTNPALLDKLVAGENPKTVLSSRGLLGNLKKALPERILNAELDHHLGNQENKTRAGNAIVRFPGRF